MAHNSLLIIIIIVFAIVYQIVHCTFANKLLNDNNVLSKAVLLPINYNIKLTFNDDLFEMNRFIGVVTIDFRIFQPINEIQIHIRNLNVTKGELFYNKITAINISNNTFRPNPKSDIVTIRLRELLGIDKEYILKMTYVGSFVEDDPRGLFKAVHVNQHGSTRMFSGARLYPNFARSVFPCFDEPSFRATFQVKIQLSKRFHVVGNTPVALSNWKGEDQIVVLAGTPKMAAHQVAFVLAEFPCVDTDLPSLQFCSTNDTNRGVQFVLRGTSKLLSSLEGALAVGWSDMNVGVLKIVETPDGLIEHDFGHWGLLSVDESFLHWEEEDVPETHQSDVALFLARKLADMWFNNFISPNSWTDMFLNNGLATLFGYEICAVVFPDWELNKMFIHKIIQTALDNDSNKFTKSLANNAIVFNDIVDYVDISAKKSASVIKMLAENMGYDNFKWAIQSFLAKNAFNTVTPTDLWQFMQLKTLNSPKGVTIEFIMKDWVEKPGFPLLIIESLGNDLIIHQEPYLKFLSFDTKWYVPIGFSKKSANTTSNVRGLWLSPEKDLKITNVLGNCSWIVFNGFYRVNYDENLWKMMAKALNEPNFGGIDELTRSEMIDNLMSLVKREMYDFAKMFELTSFLKNDTSYYSWHSALEGFRFIYEKIRNSKVKATFTINVEALQRCCARKA